MIRLVETQAEVERFAQAGVDFSRRYPHGIPRFLSSERHRFEPQHNYFLRIGGFLEAFLFVENDIVLGRVAAMVHPEHPERGLVGMFDCVNDERVAFALLDAARNSLRDQHCQTLYGPIDFSIYQPYRFMTEGFDQEAFVGEPRNPAYYPTLFEAYGFVPNHRWVSWELNAAGMDAYLAKNEIHHQTALKLGYSLRPFQSRNSSRLMKQIHRLLMESYRVFPFFTQLSESDFLQEYDLMPTLMDRKCSVFGFTPDEELYGFTLIVKDLTQALRSMDGKTDLLAKIRFLCHRHHSHMANFAQGGSLPRYIRDGFLQAARIGEPRFSLPAATVYQSVKAIRHSRKYTSVLFSLMREDGMINLHIKDFTSNQRTYAVYECPINP